MVIRGRANLRATQSRLSSGTILESFCSEELGCVGSVILKNPGDCTNSSSFSSTLPTTAQQKDDYFIYVFNPYREPSSHVTVSLVISLERQHWDIVAMGGKRVTKASSEEHVFRDYLLEHRAHDYYFVSFAYHNDNPGGKLLPILTDKRCLIAWWLVFTIMLLIVMLAMVTYVCCTMCQGDMCHYARRQK